MAIPTDTSIQLDSTQPETPVNEQPIFLAESVDSYMLNPSSIQDRAFKFSYGTQDTPAYKPEGDYNNILTEGRETNARAEAAAKLDAQATSKRFELMVKSMARKQGPLTPEDFNAIDIASGYNFPFRYPTNVGSVFEQKYAEKYASELDKFATQKDDKNFWNITKQDPTSNAQAMQQFGSILMAQHQYLLTKLQNVQGMIDKQSYLGYGVDLAKLWLVPGYSEVKARGNVQGIDMTKGWTQSEAYQAQEDQLRSLPWPEFTKAVDSIVEYKAKNNPQEAAIWLANMMGQGTADRWFNRLSTAMTVGDVAGVYKIGASVFSRALVRSQMRSAINAIVRANANPEASRESILASVGNLKASAVEKEAQVLENTIRGSTDITADAIDSLQRFYRVDRANLGDGPGQNVTRRNILREIMDTSMDALLNGLATMIRPGRIPLESLSREELLKISQEVISRYPGMKNDLIHFSDPWEEPISRRLFVTLRIGKNGGEYFNDIDEAFGRAKFHNLRVTYSPEQLADLDVRIKALKDEIKAGPAADADVHGLNYYNDLEGRLKDLERQRGDVSKPGGYRIKQQGMTHYLEVNKPVDHTTNLISELIVNPNRETSVSPNSWTKYIPYLNKVRTAEDTVSAEHRAARKGTVYPQSLLMYYAHETGKYIEDIARGKVKFDPTTGEILPWYRQGVPIVRGFKNKYKWQQFQDTLRFNQGMKDADGIEGKFFDTPMEFEDHYLRNYNRTPTLEEHLAYQANKNWWEMDHVLREVALNRDRLEVGAESHKVSYINAKGVKKESDQFDGTVSTKIGSGDGNLLILSDTHEGSVIKDMAKMSTATREKYTEDLSKQGYTFIRLYAPSDRPFKGLIKGGDSHVQWVAAKTVETSPLDWAKLPRRGGGHLVYDYPYFIKQANVTTDYIDFVRKHRYEGDTTLFPVQYRPLGEKFVERLNVIKNYIRDGKMEEAQATYRDANMPMAWDEFQNMFRSYKDSEGKTIPPRFNLKEDFKVVPRNRSIFEMEGEAMTKRYVSGDLSSRIKKGLFIDGTKQGDPSRRFMTEFTGERDVRGLMELNNTGTPQNPLWGLRPAEKVDPIEVMNRSLGKIIRSTIVDDYKTYAVQAFLQELKGKIKFSDSEIKSAPYAIFKTLNDQSFEPTVSIADRGKYMANHYKINQLLGIPSKWDTYLHTIAQDLADASYAKYGKSLVPQWLLHQSSDPTSFLRSLTFNAYLGLFSIPQLFVQTMTYVNIHGITPHYAPTGTFAAMLHGYSRFSKNPNIVNALDKLASDMHIPGLARWRPGEFKEAMEALEKSGFKNVAGEYGPLDTLNHTKLIRSSLGDFLAWGQAPFKAGERGVRIGAWYTAFKEFRDAHPTGKLSTGDLKTILDRADFLYGNMSTASNSLLHTGILSLPTQFYAYNLRLAELFLSKRVAGGLGETVSQRALARARILAVNAGMFGVPMSFGVTGLPVGDWLRQEAIDYGYTPGQAGNLITGIMEGIPSLLLAHATGNYYNIPQRYATGGFTQIRNILNSDANFYQIVGGASANLVGNTFNGFDGLWQWSTQLFRKNARPIPLKVEDFVDVFKEWSIVNKSYGLMVALNTGKWINRSGNLVMNDVSKANAIFMTATGLSPLLQSDAHNIQVNLQAQQKFEKFAMKEAQLNFQRAYIAMANNDPAQAQDFTTKGIARLEAANLTDRQIASVIVGSIKGKESIIERIAWERFIQHAPKGKQEQYRQMYGYIHNQLKGNK